MSYSVRKLTPKEFPAPLLEIPQSPKELYLAGELPDLKKFTYLTVVGSRHYSSYGRETCEKIIAGLAGYPIVIVSGLALGIEALAHGAALSIDLKTVAFPGSGLDPAILYPAANRRLAEKIISHGGALLSEMLPTDRATIYSFPKRNRLMAGIARATLIIEAGQKSGTLITARLATEYNRDVLAVPGSIFSPNSYGPNWLIKQGATPVTDSNDVLAALGFEPTENKTHQENYADLSAPEKKIIELLKIEPLGRDLLITQAKLSISEANVILSVMEIKGLIKESLGEFRLK